MLTRALIVFLVLLNVAVGLWWMLRGDPVVPEMKLPTGVAELQLLDVAAVATAQPATATAPLKDTTVEPAAPTAAASAPAPTPAVDPVARGQAPLPSPTPTATTDAIANTPAIPAPPLRCVALGPFPDQAAAQAAQSRTASALRQARLHEQPTPGASTRFRVMLPAAESREAAQATVQRIVAAGVTDYYVIGQGPDANAIALGQYRNREGAERRLAALSAAGFQAQLSGGEGASTWWLHGALADAQAGEGVRQRSGAAQQRSLDCAGLR